MVQVDRTRIAVLSGRVPEIERSEVGLVRRWIVGADLEGIATGLVIHEPGGLERHAGAPEASGGSGGLPARRDRRDRPVGKDGNPSGQGDGVPLLATGAGRVER